MLSGGYNLYKGKVFPRLALKVNYLAYFIQNNRTNVQRNRSPLKKLDKIFKEIYQEGLIPI